MRILRPTLAGRPLLGEVLRLVDTERAGTGACCVRVRRKCGADPSRYRQRTRAQRTARVAGRALNNPAPVAGLSAPGSRPDGGLASRPTRLAVMDSRRVGRSGLEVSRLGAGHDDLGSGHRRRRGRGPAGGLRRGRRHAHRHREHLRRRGRRIDPGHPGAGRRVRGRRWCCPRPPSGSAAAAAGCSPRWTPRWARLGTDHVDLWQVHGFDAAVPFEETCSALPRRLSTPAAPLRRGVRGDRLAAGDAGRLVARCRRR